MQGTPFLWGPADIDKRSWVVLSTRPHSWSGRAVEIPIGRTAGFLCLAQFCDWDPATFDPEDADVIENLGQPLADAILVYEDGTERSFPVRRRFEVNPPGAPWGRECFHARQSNTWRAASLDEPLDRGAQWGSLQCAVLPQTLSRTALWIWALDNPTPDRRVKALRLEAAGEDYLVLCGLTLYHGRKNPLRHERRRLYRFTLPSATAEEPNRWKVEADLEIVCRTFAHGEFHPEEWLKSESAGLGERGRPPQGLRHLYAEVTSSAEATLTLRDTTSGAQYVFDRSPAGQFTRRTVGAG